MKVLSKFHNWLFPLSNEEIIKYLDEVAAEEAMFEVLNVETRPQKSCARKRSEIEVLVQASSQKIGQQTLAFDIEEETIENHLEYPSRSSVGK